MDSLYLGFLFGKCLQALDEFKNAALNWKLAHIMADWSVEETDEIFDCDTYILSFEAPSGALRRKQSRQDIIHNAATAPYSKKKVYASCVVGVLAVYSYAKEQAAL